MFLIVLLSGVICQDVQIKFGPISTQKIIPLNSDLVYSQLKLANNFNQSSIPGYCCTPPDLTTYTANPSASEQIYFLPLQIQNTGTLNL
jgi:hypothetical protein